MKKVLLFVFAAVILFTSCGKIEGETDEEIDTSVTINGTAYPTIKIGNLTWTAVSYNGTGGMNYNNEVANDPKVGKLYLLTEAGAVTLPSGWRLPTKDDYAALLAAAGTVTTDTYGYQKITSIANMKLRATTSWTGKPGTNELGFNAYAAGKGYLYTNPTDLVFSAKGAVVSFWTSTAGADLKTGVGSIKTQWAVSIHNAPSYDYAELTPSISSEAYRYSIRFVKNN